MVARKRSTRKGSRKSSARKGRRSTRNRKCGGMWGGNPSNQSLAQGLQFRGAHGNQHGGAHTPLGGSSLTESSMALPQELRDMARVSGGDASFRDIVGLSDSAAPMSGGRRRGGSRKSRRGSKSRKSRRGSKSRKNNMRKSRRGSKSRKNNMRKSRRGQRGGAYTNVSGAPYGGDSMLLSPSEAARAGTADFSNPLVKH